MTKELEDRLTRLEETVYFQEQALRELNDALVRQQAQLDETERLLEAARDRLRALAKVMEDDGGKDEKILAVPAQKLTRRYDKVENYTDLPEITLKQIEHFFEHYKDLEPGKWVKIAGWQDMNVAKTLIVEAIERYKAQK